MLSSRWARNLRPEDTFFIKPRIGISTYPGDNEKSPTNFNFGMDKTDGKPPFNLTLELGYQLGNYPIITRFGKENRRAEGR